MEQQKIKDTSLFFKKMKLEMNLSVSFNYLKYRNFYKLKTMQNTGTQGVAPNP